jgi:Na+/H+-dicarboxylate symporter
MTDSIEELGKVMFKITDYVMAFAPIGVFAAIASAIFIRQSPDFSGLCRFWFLEKPASPHFSPHPG